MSVDFHLRTQANPAKSLNQSGLIDLQSYYQIHSEQLTNQYPIICARIVYHDCLLETRNEVVNCTSESSPFSCEFLDYLRSEEWLTEYPVAGELHEFILNNFHLISYCCPFSYKNAKPEYIQIVSRQHITKNLQKQFKNIAILLSQHQELYLAYAQQKSEINLLEQVLHKVGHQLINSLGLIGLCSHNLYLGLQSKSHKEEAKIIHERIQDLGDNLTDIINCSKSERLKLSLQDLRNIILESIQDLQPLIIEKNIIISIPDISTKLEADPLQMKQVFDNIFSNAVHFSPHSGKIVCTWQVFKEEIFIQISDEGGGISPEDLPQIFNPFYSRRSGGTGLGLTIAKKIVLDHQGNLWARNLSTGGAEFCLVLPRKETR